MLIDERKEIVQKEANDALEKNGNSGIIAIATGGGKSKIVIDNLKSHSKDNNKVLLVVPTEKLRDRDWKLEFEKWGELDTYNNKVDKYCYASINKLRNKNYDTVILDEGQHITPLNSEFFLNNKYRNVILLSATPPKEKEKVAILESLNLKVVYKLGVDEAVERGIISPYQIIKIELELDNTKKYIKVGNKKRSWYVTEFEFYTNLTARIEYLKAIKANGNLMKAMYLKRMRFIYNLESKRIAAKQILDQEIPKEERTLIFAGSIKIAESLEKNSYHSKSNDIAFDNFVNEKINRLSAVQALNVGVNIPNLDNALVVQTNSKERHFIQRMGRVVRYRPGHLAKIYVMYVKNTVDETWAVMSMDSLDLSNARTIKMKVNLS